MSFKEMFNRCNEYFEQKLEDKDHTAFKELSEIKNVGEISI